MVKSLYFTKYKSGILELVFTFDSKKFSECSLITYNKLLYKDLNKGKDIVFEFPPEIYQGCDLRNYIQYENTNKDQFVTIFIPDKMLIGEKDPSEVIEFEMEWLPKQKETTIYIEFKGYNPDTDFLPDNYIKETTIEAELMEFLAECTPKDLCIVNIPTIRGYITFYPIEKDGVFSWDRFTFEGNTYNVKEFVTQMATKPQQ